MRSKRGVVGHTCLLLCRIGTNRGKYMSQHYTWWVFRVALKGLLYVINYSILKLLFFKSYDMLWFSCFHQYHCIDLLHFTIYICFLSVSLTHFFNVQCWREMHDVSPSYSTQSEKHGEFAEKFDEGQVFTKNADYVSMYPEVLWLFVCVCSVVLYMFVVCWSLLYFYD